MSNKNRKGPEAFDSYYRELYNNRWPSLRESLLKDLRYAALKEGLKKAYYLDEASLLAAERLELAEEDRVLDLCAAPGGKSLVLGRQLREGMSLTANERSGKRRARLVRVLQEHLSDEAYSRVRVTGHDARKWCLYEKAAYEKILLDAPCSSERHVLASPKHLEQWSVSRPARLAVEAYAMLASALDVVRPRGQILYVTCSLDPRENDGVIGKLSKKRSNFSVLKAACTYGERTEYGWHILPDSAGGRGPIYFCLLQRKG